MYICITLVRHHTQMKCLSSGCNFAKWNFPSCDMQDQTNPRLRYVNIILLSLNWRAHVPILVIVKILLLFAMTRRTWFSKTYDWYVRSSMSRRPLTNRLRPFIIHLVCSSRGSSTWQLYNSTNTASKSVTFSVKIIVTSTDFERGSSPRQLVTFLWPFKKCNEKLISQTFTISTD